ncbi:hypothetical protein N7541_007170 [Penicillium brevicompactum]|uniref:DJ-1/PfpI domain-containing protein n=1 Tax=Penicillium brevicompactum TaxID=5074 RepID=A0A9W9QWM3_PENBR|nr:hypothetical protein N7541_007170 [Penicillium brevicompactum]
MTLETSKHYYKVGVLLFPGADILDFAGPIEVLSHVSHNRNPEDPDRMFDIKIISGSTEVRAAGSLTVQADLLISEALASLSDFHILVVPGGPPSVLNPLIKSNGPELDLVRKFSNLPSLGVQTRIIFSVCTGAFFLGAAGVLAGLHATTHHRALETLREICAQSNPQSEPATTVVQKRYVDGGFLENKAVRVITAGGISSGLDATYYIVSNLTSHDMATFVARVMEYDWREIQE